jgi:hypothetical protein
LLLQSPQERNSLPLLPRALKPPWMKVVLFFELCWKILSGVPPKPPVLLNAEPPLMVRLPPSDRLEAASSQMSSHTTFSIRQAPLLQWMPSAPPEAAMRTFLIVALFSVNTGGWPSPSPGQLVPTVMPPQSTVVLVKVAPALQATLPLLDELLLEDEELELEELLLDEELLDEDELLLELELEDELEEPPQAAATTGLRAGYATSMESIFARPALLVASSRMLLIPAFRSANIAVELVHVVQAPVAGKATAVTSAPLTSSRAGRSPEALA